MHNAIWFKNSKPKPVLLLTLIVLGSVLTGCGVFTNVGEYQVSELPEEVKAPCPHPADLLSHGGSVADDEISLGRIGDALIECGQEKDIAVTGYDSIREILVQ